MGSASYTFVDCSIHLYSKFTFLSACVGFLSKQVTSVVKQSTRKSVHMISSKLELDIKPVSGETWIGFPPSARLEGDRVYTPRNRKKKKNEAASS